MAKSKTQIRIDQARTAVLTKRVATAIRAMDRALKDLNGDEYDRDNTWMKPEHAAKARALGIALLLDLFGPSHEMVTTFTENTAESNEFQFRAARGVLGAVEVMVKDDWLTSTRSLIIQRVFSDYLDMAEHLYNEKYDSAAAVIAMGAVEVHIRNLANKYGVPTESVDKSGYKRPRAAESLNEDLYKMGAYDMAEQKLVLAYLDVRKHAAHGKHENVRHDSVELMIPWARGFTKRYPA